MSGVIDDTGQQWEHCNMCDAWVQIEELWYQPKTPDYPHGRDLCVSCAHKLFERNIEVQSPRDWRSRA